MGSFSSKVHSIRNGVNLRETSKEEIDSGIEGLFRSTADASSETAENSSSQEQAQETNGDELNNGGATSHEQKVTPRVRQSFSWLASSPVVLISTENEQKGKGRKPKEGRMVSSDFTKYTNEKYLNSLQLSPETSSLKTERKQHCDAGSSSSSSAGSNTMREKKDTTMSGSALGPSLKRDAFSLRVGFGSESFQPPTTSMEASRNESQRLDSGKNSLPQERSGTVSSNANNSNQNFVQF